MLDARRRLQSAEDWLELLDAAVCAGSQRGDGSAARPHSRRGRRICPGPRGHPHPRI